MTAVEFLRKRDSIQRWCLLGPAIATTIAFTIILICLRDGLRALGYATVVAFVAMLSFIVTPFLQDYLLKRFAARHPEMENLDEWIKEGGTAQNHPTTDPIKAGEFVIFTALARARVADVVMQMRDRIKTQKEIFPPNDPGIMAYERLVDHLEQRAKEVNDSYLSFWDMAIKAGVQLAGSPKYFREQKSIFLYSQKLSAH